MMEMEREQVKNRRPLKSRNTWWARVLTSFVARTPLSPNAISLVGVLFAVAGFGIYVLVGHYGLSFYALLGAAACIQMRLLCNMMDGLVAVEAGKSAPTGVLFNEAPDRLEDVLFLLGAGVATAWPFWGLQLGWLCAALALGTAYVRVLGGSLGLEQDFCGPMAKQHRMFFLTVGTLGVVVEWALAGSKWTLPCVLGLIAAGSLVTLFRRIGRIVRQLNARA
jgi:phosphatidylglycerophosphate synthase